METILILFDLCVMIYAKVLTNITQYFVLHWNDRRRIEIGRLTHLSLVKIWMRVLKMQFSTLFYLFRFSHDIALGWMPWDPIDSKSALFQVMAWRRQVTNYYLSYWSWSLSPLLIDKKHTIYSPCMWVFWRKIQPCYYRSVLYYRWMSARKT